MLIVKRVTVQFRLLATMLLVIASPPMLAASFDCAKAKTSSEKTICSDQELSKLDEALAQRFSSSLNAATSEQDKAQLRKEQRSWLISRDLCTSTKCFIDVYRQRVDKLEANESFLKLKKPDSSDICADVADRFANRMNDKGKLLGTTVVSKGHTYKIDDRGYSTALVSGKGEEEKVLLFSDSVEFWSQRGTIYALINLALHSERGVDKSVLRLDGKDTVQVCKFRQQVIYSTKYTALKNGECERILSESKMVETKAISNSTLPVCSMGVGCTFSQADIDIDNDGVVERVIVESYTIARPIDYSRMYINPREGSFESKLFDKIYSEINSERQISFDQIAGGLKTSAVTYAGRTFIVVDAEGLARSVYLGTSKNDSRRVCKFSGNVTLRIER